MSNSLYKIKAFFCSYCMRGNSNILGRYMPYRYTQHGANISKSPKMHEESGSLSTNVLLIKAVFTKTTSI